MGRSIKAKERRIKELEDRIALLVQTPGGPLHCLTCGKQSRDRWCGELCREKWITAASVGAEWVWIVAEAIFRAEESRK